MSAWQIGGLVYLVGATAFLLAMGRAAARGDRAHQVPAPRSRKDRSA